MSAVGGRGGGGFGGGVAPVTTRGVFVSHASEDAPLAEAFRELIQDVSAGMIPTFSSSSKESGVGIPYGDDWFDWIEARIRESGNVVALITPSSVGRPWILFEAGFGRAIEGVKVFGLRLGTTGEEAYDGPFRAFQNSGSKPEDLKKLCYQLFEGTSCNPRQETVLDFCEKFVGKVEAHFEAVKTIPKEANPESEAVFKALDEIKLLFQQRYSGFGEEYDERRFMDLDHAFHVVMSRQKELDPAARVTLMLGIAQEAGMGWLTPAVQYALDHPVGLEPLFDGLMELASHRRMRTPFPPDFFLRQLFDALGEHQIRRFRRSRSRLEPGGLTAAELLHEDEDA